MLHCTLIRFLERVGTLTNIQSEVTSELLECFSLADDSVDVRTDDPTSPEGAGMRVIHVNDNSSVARVSISTFGWSPCCAAG